MGVWHSAHVVAGGWLSGVYSGSVSVLSYHHQSIRDLAPGFQVDMRAGDGTVEAISNSAKRVYGVQFHPEQMNNDAGNRCMKQEGGRRGKKSKCNRGYRWKENGIYS